MFWAVISGDGCARGFGCASLSGPRDHDPRSNEQPPSSSASNATSREILQKALVVEKAMPAECSRVQCRIGSLPGRQNTPVKLRHAPAVSRHGVPESSSGHLIEEQMDYRARYTAA